MPRAHPAFIIFIFLMLGSAYAQQISIAISPHWSNPVKIAQCPYFTQARVFNSGEIPLSIRMEARPQLAKFSPGEFRLDPGENKLVGIEVSPCRNASLSIVALGKPPGGGGDGGEFRVGASAVMEMELGQDHEHAETAQGSGTAIAMVNAAIAFLAPVALGIGYMVRRWRRR